MKNGTFFTLYQKECDFNFTSFVNKPWKKFVAIISNNNMAKKAIILEIIPEKYSNIEVIQKLKAKTKKKINQYKN